MNTINPDQQPNINSQPQTNLTPTTSSTSKKPCCKGIIWLGVSIILLALIGGGVWFFLNINKPQPISVQPNPIASTSATLDQTADWKTYTNTDFNFSVKYPDTIQINKAGEGGPANTYINIPNIQTNDSAEKTLIIFYYVTDETPEDKVNTLIEQNRLDTTTTVVKMSSEKYENNNIQGIKLISKFSNLTRYQIFLKHNKAMYQFVINASLNNDITTQAIVDQILSTFKFLDETTDTSSWKTYESSQLNYSFKYPSTYTIYSPTPDGKYESRLDISSNLNKSNLALSFVVSKQNYISLEETLKTFQYSSWDWKNKESKIIIINGQKTFWMIGEENDKKQELWLIEGKNYYFEFRTLDDYDSTIINSIINSFTSF